MGRDLNRHFSEKDMQMANRHMKRCSTLANHQVTTNQNHNEISPHNIKKNTNDKCWQGCGEMGPLVHCWPECKLVQPLWKTAWRFLRKLKTELTYMTQQFHSWVYIWKKGKTLIWKDTCTPMFTAATIYNCQYMEAT